MVRILWITETGGAKVKKKKRAKDEGISEVSEDGNVQLIL